MKRQDVLFALLIALVLAIVLSPFASPWPDGLEKVAEDKGFLEKGEIEPAVFAPVPDYVFPGLESEGLATSTAGALGTLIMFGLGYGLGLIIRKH